MEELIKEASFDHIDLFSGIGGFALAARWNGLSTRVFCEIDPFCQRVLKKHWPDVPIIPDIRDINGTDYRGSWLLTGGFPCQPFSCAGKRKGTADNRFLWPEMCRVIREAQPEWVLAENVSGLLSQDGGMVFERVLTDLEDAGYETLPLVIPACGVGAPHRRDRVWIVGRTKEQLITESKGSNGERNTGELVGQTQGQEELRAVFTNDARHAPHTIGARTGSQGTKTCDEGWRSCEGGRESIRQEDRSACSSGVASADCNASNPDRNRTQRNEPEHRERGGPSEDDCHATKSESRKSREQTEPEGREDSGRGNQVIGDSERGQLAWSQDRRFSGRQESNAIRDHWNESWLEVATRLCRVDDGIPKPMDRVNRLKALGNSIVPQVAYEIIRAIRESHGKAEICRAVS